MSSFSKKGYKESQKKFVKFHSKGVNIILEQLNVIYDKLSNNIHPDLAEDTLAEYAALEMGRELDSMELNILKGKFGFHEQEDNAE